jgi:hypothetical protein
MTKGKQTDETLAKFNEQQPTMKFIIEKELRNCINFLNLSIHHKEKEMKFTIYRKPTQTDITIPNNSCHPHEHNMSIIDYLVNRLNTYPLSREAKEKELNFIKNTT